MLRRQFKISVTAPFLHFEQAGLDVNVDDLNILEGGLVGSDAPSLRPSPHRARQTEAVFHYSMS
jgi:hypothetical protein